MKLTHLLAGTALLGTVLTAPLCAAESAAKRVAKPAAAAKKPAATKKPAKRKR